MTGHILTRDFLVDPVDDIVAIHGTVSCFCLHDGVQICFSVQEILVKIAHRGMDSATSCMHVTAFDDESMLVGSWRDYFNLLYWS